MAGLRRCFWRWGGLVRCGAVMWACGLPIAAQEGAFGLRAWKGALAMREAFEAEPVGTHTRAEYAGVMEGFRAIYHGDPGDLYAPRAVNAVAELLAEEGREFKDRKALRDAAGQYEFLAKAYPGSSLAAPGLGKALDLLGPDGVEDAAEAAKVRLVLKEGYPRSATALAVGDRGMVRGGGAGSAGADRDSAVEQPLKSRFPAGVTDGRAMPAPDAVADAGGKRGLPSGVIPKEAAETSGLGVDNQRRVGGAAPAVVSGIRHWSTASYTRVAIDLGGEVEFQAARVEHPDRIFLDLHGATLAPGLVGKSFTIMDEGFLKTIRAAQSKPDVTRIVLDVEPVAEYSAFLLPNPTRLIIDIHGKAAGQRASESAGQRVSGVPASQAGSEGQESSAPPAVGKLPGGGKTTERAESAPIERASPGDGVSPGTRSAEGRGNQISSLPPMPVTDGSAGFGLPPKRTEAVAGNQPVARPRVVVTSKPTMAKPVPNAVSSPVPASNREVASVSEGPGVISATAAPTSKPVVDKGNRKDAVSAAAASDRGSHLPAPTHKGPMAGAEMAAVPNVPAPPTADGQSTLMRALGLKIGRIVIDAGHGGHDSGTLGADGIEEKDVVLDVALRLGKLLHDRLGAEVVYTRADDTFIPLETRTAIANKAQADLFISVHANSSGDPSARGVEVYYLNFTSDPDAMAVAGRENAVSSQRVNQLSDLVKKIALKDKIDESRELAADVDTSLYAGLKKGNEGLKDRGVKKAPFVVLIGANMPSILAEISFVTNPDDAGELSQPEYRERVAESLYRGVARYAGAVNGAPAGIKKAKATEQAAR